MNMSFPSERLGNLHNSMESEIRGCRFMFQRGAPQTSMWVSRHAMPGRETTKFRARAHHSIHFIARISQADNIVWLPHRIRSMPYSIGRLKPS